MPFPLQDLVNLRRTEIRREVCTALHENIALQQRTTIPLNEILAYKMKLAHRGNDLSNGTNADD